MDVIKNKLTNKQKAVFSILWSLGPDKKHEQVTGKSNEMCYLKETELLPCGRADCDLEMESNSLSSFPDKHSHPSQVSTQEYGTV